ncbi:MAG: SagB/ThcOx family dehydrogenase [Candidatus Abyssobacteria bacterium SURF_5]|jgi:SagB-type dehydrogenase family enzyme|uniref:SagB/ThcOx family dehydrogenase n=1 Tax=Abyssobacteria bacterium (strain SURF_5) TaxID=2093360 RepID=A0A3A4NJA7_ABYX5|nr:MAG: SagB/ThcOx family dehydrogenase [Candidatus Abyssubacteria bacterium SURF_5]
MEQKVQLPEPSLRGTVSVEEAIKNRRTVRTFSKNPLTLKHLSQVLWAAQGTTGDTMKFRSVPSAGIIYPLDLYVVIGQNAVQGLPVGVYRYLPDAHALERLREGDKRQDVAQAAFGQSWMTEAPVLLVISAEYDRLMERYGDRAVRYADLEAGHAGQNVFLQAEAEGLGAGIVGVSNPTVINEVLGAATGEEPLTIMPVGYKGF